MTFTISRIEPQKKNKNRFSLFSGDTFLIGITSDTMLKYNLHAGDTISSRTLAEIGDSENGVLLREQAYRFLARRAHSIQELREKLQRKGFTPESIAPVLEELKHKNYLNDPEFARLFLADELKLRKSGPLLIKQKLIVKGIEPGHIDELIARVYNEEQQQRNCRYLARKKLSSLVKKTPPKQKQQLADYLKAKGYRWSTIQSVVNELIQEENNEPG
jgi:regulatory protein